MRRSKESFRFVEQVVGDIPAAAYSSQQHAKAHKHIACKELAAETIHFKVLLMPEIVQYPFLADSIIKALSLALNIFQQTLSVDRGCHPVGNALVPKSGAARQI